MAKRRPARRIAKGANSNGSGIKSNTEQSKPVEESINNDAIAAALSTASRVMMKVCRLCETKDGPFLNIFGAENMTAKKIDDIMPFVIAENDDLPHKICFRCSAKVEELYEFIQKCTKTQESLRKALGKNEAVTPKVKTRILWEEKLNESNMSNDDICNALIRKAMEGIKDIPSMPIKDEVKDEPKVDIKKDKEVKSKEKEIKPKEIESKRPNTRQKQNSQKDDDSPLKSFQSQLDKVDKDVPKPFNSVNKHLQLVDKKEAIEQSEIKPINTNDLSIEIDDSDNSKDAPKPFNIMDHVSTIKVTGVGILFQCKLCNRNFLKKEVVMSHGCAKNGGKKIAEEVKTVVPEPPKIPQIKYINIKTKPELTDKTQVLNDSPINIDDDEDDEDDKPLKARKKKPKIGPASKVKRNENKSPLPKATYMTTEETAKTIVSAFSMPLQQSSPGTIVLPPTVEMPNMSSRYKLVPGPNNTFTLVEDKLESSTSNTNQLPTVANNFSTTASSNQQALINNYIPSNKGVPTPRPSEPASEQPYPVGLIKKVSHQTAYPSIPELFTTPAMRKQSYTVVQTGNPSKLLISTKPQAEPEPPKKKSRKVFPGELNRKTHTEEVDNQQKNTGLFTFVNVDPVMQPSYVLPTNNIIQESQISTSTTAKPTAEKEKDKYSCNMCGDKFSREKKLLSHIQSHYNKMDEEDQLRAQKNSKKRKSNT